MKYLVLTIAIGDNYTELAKITHPSIKAYSERINSDFMVIDKPYDLPHWNKFEIFKLLTKYDRIIYFDTDLVIRSDCPNLFEIVPEYELGVFNEGVFVHDRIISLKQAAEKFEIDVNLTSPDYYNTGVMVVSRNHRNIFKKPQQVFNTGYFEQDYINLQILKQKVKMCDLHYRYNRMSFLDTQRILGMPRHDSYIIHYAGAPDFNELSNVVRADLEIWKNSSPEFKYTRKIVVSIGGGLGDQLCAEPVVRKITRMYEDSDISVVTNFPRFFEHLKVKCFEPDELVIKDQSILHLDTMPGPEKSIIWRYMPHTLTNSTDFSSMCAIRRILPDLEKTIVLKAKLEGLSEILDIVGLQDVSEFVLVHPGLGWPSKTFPKEWWNGIIDGLVEKNYKVGVIGKKISDTQGYVDVNIPEGVYDFRDLLSLDGLITLISQAKVLISNDSAPIHIAGAFDNYIILIPTCKHPDHVLPYRKGNKYYRSFALYKKLTIDAIDSSPHKIHGQTLDYVIGDIMDYLPDPEEVISTTELCMSR